ncbi:hypothetical protein [Occallatibacter savannae]|uniref:hypothetical protein n=1 Tax=Occallatibacter savannae TaxID=1002691 RepID=UPI0013A5BA01|nr:hypothetical protein [Occallatibacter savannae]
MDKIINLFGREINVPHGVRVFSVLELDLFEFTHRHPRPPTIFGFPPESQMTLNRGVQLDDEIDIHEKRKG